MTVLKVAIALGEDESYAARVDLHGALDSHGKTAAKFVLPGHVEEFFVHSGITLRVSAVPEEQAMLAISAQALSKARGGA